MQKKQITVDFFSRHAVLERLERRGAYVMKKDSLVPGELLVPRVGPWQVKMTYYVPEK